MIPSVALSIIALSGEMVHDLSVNYPFFVVFLGVFVVELVILGCFAIGDSGEGGVRGWVILVWGDFGFVFAG